MEGSSKTFADRLPAPLKVIVQSLRLWWDDLINLVVINIVFVLCWVTVVLGPPATFAIYSVTNSLSHGEGQGLREMFTEGKKYFLKSWGWMIINLFAVLALYTSFYFYGQIDTSWAVILQVVIIGVAYTWSMTQFYALPYFMEQDVKSLKIAFRNGVLTFLASPGFSLVMVIVIIIVVVLGRLVIFPLIFGGPLYIAVLGNRAVQERIDAFKKIRESKEE